MHGVVEWECVQQMDVLIDLIFEWIITFIKSCKVVQGLPVLFQEMPNQF